MHLKLSARLISFLISMDAKNRKTNRCAQVDFFIHRRYDSPTLHHPKFQRIISCELSKMRMLLIHY
jgi:hypothetical protein